MVIPSRADRWKQYYEKNKERVRARLRAKHSKNRDAVFKHYGNECVCCGEGNRAFLTVDHVNDDGWKYRKRKDGNPSSHHNIYGWIVRNEFPSGFQILCRNCNWGKEVNNGICPHLSEGVEIIPQGSSPKPDEAQRLDVTSDIG